MKKVVVFLGVLFSIIFISCSKNDDNTISDKDLIIGIWKPTKQVFVNFNGSEEVNNAGACEQKSRYIFSENGEVSIVMFGDYNDDGGCVEYDGFILLEGHWENISPNKYKLTMTYHYPDTKQTETEIDIPDEVSFPDTNTMRVRYNDLETYHYDYAEFVRVN